MADAPPLPRADDRRGPAGGAFDPRGTLLATIAASSLAFVLGSIVNVALPSMQAAFGTDPRGAQWIVNAYLLPLGALVLLGGALGDRFGRRRVFRVGLLLFAASCLAAALAPTFPILLAARAVEGVAAALIAPTSLAIIADAFPGPARGRAVGTWAGVSAAAGALAPVAGGVIVDAAGWRWAFAAVVPVALLAHAIAGRAVRESRAPRADCAPLDWIGGALISAALLAFVWGLVELPARGGAPAVLLALAAGAALFAAFLWTEHRRRDDAMVPLALFAGTTFAGLTAFTFLLYAALGGLLLLLPYVLIEGAGYSATQAGLAILPFPAIIASASRLAGGPLTDRFGARAMLTAGAAGVALGFALLTGMPPAPDYVRDVLPGIVVLACGMALAVAPLTSAVLSAAGEDRTGVASGINNAVSRIGGLIATAMLGLVLLDDALLAGFAGAAWAGAGLAAASAVIAWRTVGPEPTD